MNGKLIVIEGTDCSGKETQRKLLKTYLENQGRKVFEIYFPYYESPTGKIIGGPYLGKENICKGWFPETAVNVDPKVASLFYAADRYYNLPKIEEHLKRGEDVIVDRYTYSNMGHQGGKIKNKEDRIKMYHWLEKLEFEFLGLPLPDIKIFLHMPFDAEKILRKNRKEKADEHESNNEHLINSENAYLEIAEIFNFEKIECAKQENIDSIADIKTPENIHEEIIEKIKLELN